MPSLCFRFSGSPVSKPWPSLSTSLRRCLKRCRSHQESSKSKDTIEFNSLLSSLLFCFRFSCSAVSKPWPSPLTSFRRCQKRCRDTIARRFLIELARKHDCEIFLSLLRVSLVDRCCMDLGRRYVFSLNYLLAHYDLYVRINQTAKSFVKVCQNAFANVRFWLHKSCFQLWIHQVYLMVCICHCIQRFHASVSCRVVFWISFGVKVAKWWKLLLHLLYLLCWWILRCLMLGIQDITHFCNSLMCHAWITSQFCVLRCVMLGIHNCLPSALLSDGWCLEFMVASHFSIIVRCLECTTFTFHVCMIYHCSLKLD